MLSAVARVFEQLVYDQLSDNLERNNFLTKYQSGYRKFHFIVTAMLKTSNDWLLNMDKGLFIGIKYFDLKKVSDTVDHDILLHKLSIYGLLDIELDWFHSYLSNRKQICSLGGVQSGIREIKVGVPQGS